MSTLYKGGKIMQKRFSIIITIIGVLILTIGCSAGEKPDKVVSEFVEGMKEFDFEKMSSKINPDNVGDIDEILGIYDNEEGSLENHFMEYIKENARKITYTINESKIDGKDAEVNVSFKYVDGGPLFKSTFREYMKELFVVVFSHINEEVSDEQYTDVFIKAMEEQKELIEESFVEKNLDIECIKIQDNWYIDELDDDILDVLMSNMISAMEEIGEEDSFEELDEDED